MDKRIIKCVGAALLLGALAGGIAVYSSQVDTSKGIIGHIKKDDTSVQIKNGNVFVQRIKDENNNQIVNVVKGNGNKVINGMSSTGGFTISQTENGSIVYYQDTDDLDSPQLVIIEGADEIELTTENILDYIFNNNSKGK